MLEVILAYWIRDAKMDPTNPSTPIQIGAILHGVLNPNTKNKFTGDFLPFLAAAHVAVEEALYGPDKVDETTSSVVSRMLGHQRY
jgi:hypothetical protein